ncbi:hypothetical protein GALMADRAFT_135538 [Galerina marginata CBS 339.88]|uniref:G-protein coupled receptors family 1 profile domain-containing protein n=1 Tax=Galerina marginata (strain CBS 339.88) TaxID=685588 RepID=A0A067TIJ5_GALM3|nr:hypothetical protein GALMADRAFT_135538 [Galerina marginata CBS 339.88]
MTSASIVAFDILCFLGMVLLIAVFCTAWCSSKVPRASTWFNFIASCILATVVNLLILGQQAGKSPNRTSCVIQAISTYSVTVLSAHTAAALIFQAYLCMIFIRKSRRLSVCHIRLLNIVPFLTPIGIQIYGITIGLQNPSLLQRDQSGMRCYVVARQLHECSVLASLVGVFMLFVLEVLVVFNLFRFRRTYEVLLTGSKMSPRVIIRVCFFNVFVFMAVIASLVPVGNSLNDKGIVDLTAAIIPVAAGIIFGTQKDILTVWMFWRSPAMFPVPSSV